MQGREHVRLRDQPEQRQGAGREQGNSELPSLWLEARRGKKAKSLEYQAQEAGGFPGATVEPLVVISRACGAPLCGHREQTRSALCS